MQPTGCTPTHSTTDPHGLTSLRRGVNVGRDAALAEGRFGGLSGPPLGPQGAVTAAGPHQAAPTPLETPDMAVPTAVVRGRDINTPPSCNVAGKCVQGVCTTPLKCPRLVASKPHYVTQYHPIVWLPPFSPANKPANHHHTKAKVGCSAGAGVHGYPRRRPTAGARGGRAPTQHSALGPHKSVSAGV